MQSQIIHSNYLARIVLEIRLWENGIEFSSKTDTENNPARKNFPYRNYGILLHSFNVNNKSVWFLIFDEELNKDWLLNEYFLDLYQTGSSFPNGGLAFIDNENEGIIQTNWDMGETEEWSSIINKLHAANEVMHTFSATDAAIELKAIENDVSLQNLNWEEMPDRLITSRNTAPLHLFKEKNKFEDGINKCINTLGDVVSRVKVADQTVQHFMLGYFSTKYRRQNRY